jgi:hypothetical protein
LPPGLARLATGCASSLFRAPRALLTALLLLLGAWALSSARVPRQGRADGAPRLWRRQRRRGRGRIPHPPPRPPNSGGGGVSCRSCPQSAAATLVKCPPSDLLLTVDGGIPYSFIDHYFNFNDMYFWLPCCYVKGTSKPAAAQPHTIPHCMRLSAINRTGTPLAGAIPSGLPGRKHGTLVNLTTILMGSRGFDWPVIAAGGILGRSSWALNEPIAWMTCQRIRLHRRSEQVQLRQVVHKTSLNAGCKLRTASCTPTTQMSLSTNLPSSPYTSWRPICGRSST